MTTCPLQCEADAAVSAVRIAASVCQAVQRDQVSSLTLVKGDRSPVTVADFASQAVICAMLAEHFPDDPVVAEEDCGPLRQTGSELLRGAVAQHVAAGLDRQVDQDQVLAWIDRGSGTTSVGRFWTLDPIDGTKGFLRREHYAVALALIEDGHVTLGALACPKLQYGQHTGLLMLARRGAGTSVLPLADARAEPLAQVRVLDGSDPAAARFCESVESDHSDQQVSHQIAASLGIPTPPLRMDSQAKYAAVACGHAAIYMRLPMRADYREKIWDHAAGSIVVQEAGGRVSDIDGRPLQFTHGRQLNANRGVLATNGRLHEAVIGAIGRRCRAV